MENFNRIEPIAASRQFIMKYFPKCDGALLAGSVVRGEATETSDLDIVIFDKAIDSAYRESLIDFDWRIEVFVHNLSSYQSFFESDCKRARPSLPRMISEGFILKDNGFIESIKDEANELLSKGPEKWSIETIHTKRYFITDTLDDFISCNDRAEGIFIANSLAELVCEFVLRTNNRWIGASKWVIRSLRNYDVMFAEQYVEAFELYYKSGEKHKVIKLVDEILQPYGGRLFEGFSLGKK
ncbi:nucleotidyltransferase domain-containing protein [Ornithinibacillus sp. L9]|uniref:Nucleotidyltransferase domain-containing protein n=1 Tax=Ornithinibacillus caprae TaxID=2678566 RepID=A0A6N8FJG8_9BACI|nr:nucleotidyltransferase domain-containing protein [Ornithinibacillus caprae]MUK87899.1 nucleotidyltransferase domain-containing protein [Ornithinibacillus caprae]